MIAEAENEVENPESATDETDEIFTRLKRWFRESLDASREWRGMAKEDFDFVAGNQWTDEERRLLQEQLRPVVCFNRIDPVISAVQGTELQNRHEITYSPREIGDAGVNEVLSAVSDQMQDGCDAAFVESDAFGDLVICGMGWVEGNMDYVDDPEGKYVENAIDPLEMYWDMGSRKKNLSDARFVFRVKKMPKIEAIENHPDADEELLHAAWADDSEDGGNGNKKSPNDSYSGEGEKIDDLDEVIIVEAQWWEKKTFYSVLDPVDGQIKEFNEDDYEEIKKRIVELGQPAPKEVKRQRKVYRQAFIGKEILEIKELDCGQFKYKAMTGKRDRNKNIFYGLVRGMKDPQRWANKWLSQTLHIINSNAKGGVKVEIDAVPNARDFEETWSRPDKVTWLNPGGLNKIMQKDAIVFPSGLDKLMEFAIASIRDTSGVNMELLGLANRDQAGVLENTRKEAGLTILAFLFDAIRLLRRELGRLRLFYIQNYMSDGRIIRIVRKDQAQYVRLTKDQTIGKFDVIVDESATSPNQKEKVFAALMQLLPGIMKMGVPVPPDILDYMPLPTGLTKAWKQHIDEQKQAASQQVDPATKKAEGELALKQQAAQADAQIKAQSAEHDMQIKERQAQADMHIKGMTTMADIALEQQKQESNAKLAAEKNAAEIISNIRNSNSGFRIF